MGSRISRAQNEIAIGAAFPPRVLLVSQSFTGTEIVRPGSRGREIVFLLAGSADSATFDAVAIAQFELEARREGTSTWDKVNDKNGSPVLFNSSEWNGTNFRGKVRMASMPTGAIPDGYDAIRWRVTAVGGAITVGISYFVFDRYSRESQQQDYLRGLMV